MSSTAAISICKTSVDNALGALDAKLLVYAKNAREEWKTNLSTQSQSIATQLMEGVEEDLDNEVPSWVNVNTDVSAGDNKLTVYFSGTAGIGQKRTDLSATSNEVSSQYNQWNGSRA